MPLFWHKKSGSDSVTSELTGLSLTPCWICFNKAFLPVSVSNSQVCFFAFPDFTPLLTSSNARGQCWPSFSTWRTGDGDGEGGCRPKLPQHPCMVCKLGRKSGGGGGGEGNGEGGVLCHSLDVTGSWGCEGGGRGGKASWGDAALCPTLVVMPVFWWCSTWIYTSIFS